ncbi:hybrid sensor histidine kinase/response regulator [Ralstonia solanacearum]|uniref:hybrid sensor histidine kinase/response regulator n=1 Tax=Ralstonia solanacearum TaxID=305 RepID=UPI00078B2528|nr:hybrid sensor histidine kinase/response regulator [Ralstonia solanacearum]AMP40496.1 hybrid sensor histidine kinase/response regulator [Ralstonia solanacearum]AXV89355.1 hybrid sensor histidine kinase/response regulator [Ralstonia solanacearum]AXW08818.1 hybrid sensor histidine kinase/response regulator [Ralstonia solanacearum]AXW26602.1 hybrid sensor histidine kinase/response regulator [Ralstonia solanacearum]AXW83518.1 hybrid sensor histidine kinase/response regulator [Ralstonia solanacea
MSTDDDPGRQSLLALFHEEAQTQGRVLSDGLLTLEHAPADTGALEACMRAAHSLKGAARIIGLQDGVDVAHRMEEGFVAAQRGELTLSTGHIDVLLRGTDLLLRLGQPNPAGLVTRADVDAFIASMPASAGASGRAAEDATLRTALARLGTESAALTAGTAGMPRAVDVASAPPVPVAADDHSIVPPGNARDPQRMLRVRADSLDRLLSLSGESLVESRWLKPFAESMLRVKRTHRETAHALDACYERLVERLDPDAHAALNAVRQMLGSLQQALGEHVDELDRFDRRSTGLAQQLYDEALQCRMRPFGDATHAYPRLVRDLARSLGKRVRFAVVGETTQVDRDILDLLDAPLGHLLRNAIDHGIEPPEQRAALGKPAEAAVTLEARHSAGKLLIIVADDGAGIDLEAVRAAVVRRGLADPETAGRLSDPELLEFLLLPGFSMRDRVTDVSGRGVGLDAVHEMVKAVRGTVRIHNEPGRGARFVLQLPLTLSVIRSLLVDVGGEAYAFPLAHVRRTLELSRNGIDMLEGQQHFPFEGRPVGLVMAHQLFGTRAPDGARESAAVVVIGEGAETYGIAVDRFLGERMLVVQPLDARLGKVRDIAAAALMENGEAVLIVDVDDLLRSVDRLVRGGRLDKVQRGQGATVQHRKHVLVVDDSLTVRELERKLLEKRGYAVTVAVDGMDGWNALRGTPFDLVVTDIDMPRMDGIELVTLIKRDAALKALPVMIVSYKDREEDRRRGLEAGADYYLAKGSFHDEALLDAVQDLIGEAYA